MFYLKQNFRSRNMLYTVTGYYISSAILVRLNNSIRTLLAASAMISPLAPPDDEVGVFMPVGIRLGVFRPLGVFLPVGIPLCGVLVPSRGGLVYVPGDINPCGVRDCGDSIVGDKTLNLAPSGEGSRDPALEFDRDGFRDGIRDPGRVDGRSVAVVLTFVADATVAALVELVVRVRPRRVNALIVCPAPSGIGSVI